jgi:hypothetical protein
VLLVFRTLSDLAAECVTDQFGSRFHTEISHNFVFMRLGSSCGNVQLLTDFLHCPAFGQQPHDIALTGSE